MMKVAFLMLCHKNPKQINLLLKALKHPQIDVFIHVDSKNENIREDIEKSDGVYLLPKKDCVDVQWAQFSEVKATLNLLNVAISKGGGYSHYFLISGQDFPLKSIGKIVRFLNERKDENFIDCALIKRFEKRNDIYFPRMVIGRRIWQKILKGILVYSTGGWNQTFSIIKRLKPANVQYYFGSQWWCLNDAMVKWIYNFLENYPEYIKLFKHSLCPDECFFQTLVMNSPFANTTKPYLHYIKWEKGKSSLKTLTTIDYEELKKAEKLIARKFDINVDAEIIERLRMRYAE
jgi:hypothetical protein